jgi:hypothetical protein
MPTLRIEHPITDFDTWKAAFDRFAEHRLRAGVVAVRILRPVDDLSFILVDLDFAGRDDAQAFRRFLQTSVWAVPASSPGLAGAPSTAVLDLVETG